MDISKLQKAFTIFLPNDAFQNQIWFKNQIWCLKDLFFQPLSTALIEKIILFYVVKINYSAPFQTAQLLNWFGIELLIW